jgi:hypothetical protein
MNRPNVERSHIKEPTLTSPIDRCLEQRDAPKCCAEMGSDDKRPNRIAPDVESTGVERQVVDSPDADGSIVEGHLFVSSVVVGYRLSLNESHPGQHSPRAEHPHITSSLLRAMPPHITKTRA